MTEPTSNNTFTAQCAKAALCSVTALLEKIKTAEFTTEAVKELSHLLCSIDKALEKVVSLFDQPQSCIVKLGDQHHLRMAIWSNQGACERYQDNFTKWTSHSNDDFLRDSEWNFFDIFKDIESRLLSERLRLFKDTIDKAVQTSALYVNPEFPILPIASSLGFFSRLTTFSTSENISDDEWDSILVKESSLLLAIIEANKCHHAHQLIERAAERIICEIKGHGIAMQHHRNFLDGLLVEFRQLRWGQRTDSWNQDQLFPNAVSDLPDES
ncbi:hypothetical protein N7490_006207 [Penicillium lividum]|nr:hypothetical protein N7490_006207 [Penicillium lividum]